MYSSFLFCFNVGLLRSPSGDEGEQLRLHDDGLRRRRVDGRHDRGGRRHQTSQRKTPAPPGKTTLKRFKRRRHSRCFTLSSPGTDTKRFNKPLLERSFYKQKH